MGDMALWSYSCMPRIMMVGDKTKIATLPGGRLYVEDCDCEVLSDRGASLDPQPRDLQLKILSCPAPHTLTSIDGYYLTHM
jgi:hypothetical protein